MKALKIGGNILLWVIWIPIMLLLNILGIFLQSIIMKKDKRFRTGLRPPRWW